MSAKTIVVYTAITTGPYYMTQSQPKADKNEALKDAVTLQQDEVYSAIVTKITVTVDGDNVSIGASAVEYDGDEACRMVGQDGG